MMWVNLLSSCVRSNPILPTFNVTESVRLPDNTPSLTLLSPTNTELICLGESPFSLLNVPPGSRLGRLALANLTVSGCASPNSGAVVHLRHNSTNSGSLAVAITGCTFARCTAPCGGACLDLVDLAGAPGPPMADSLDVSITGSHFVGSHLEDTTDSCTEDLPPWATVPQGGAAIRVVAGPTGRLNLTGCSFADMEVRAPEPWGGALLVDGPLAGAALRQCTFTGCRLVATLSGRGGAVAVRGAAALELIGCAFADVWIESPAEGYGGALAFSPSSTAAWGRLVNSTFQQCRVDAADTARGGALWASGLHRLEVAGSLFTECSLTGDAGSGAGLALWDATELLLEEGSRFEGNHIRAASSAMGAALASVGAVLVELRGGAHFSQNTVSLSNSGEGEARGGAVALVPPASGAPARCLLEGGIFAANMVTGHNARGGALHLADGNVRLAMRRVQWHGNQASTPLALVDDSSAFGGALAVGRAQSVAAEDCTFAGNAVDSQVRPATLPSPATPASSRPPPLRLRLHPHRARPPADDPTQRGHPQGQGGGGAVHLEKLQGSLDVAGCAFVGNAVDARATAQVAEGGALYCQEAAATAINQTQFVENSLTGAGFAVGGAASLYKGTATLDGVTVRGSVVRSKAAAWGGGLSFRYCLAVTVRGGRFEGNNVTSTTDAAGAAGMLALETAQVALEGPAFRANTAQGAQAFGAALALLGLQAVQVTGADFQGNLADGQTLAQGGVLYLSECTARVALTGCAMAANGARAETVEGAALFLKPSDTAPVAITGCSFLENVAMATVSGSGGAVTVVNGGGLEVRGCQANGNRVECAGCVARGSAFFVTSIEGDVTLAQNAFVGSASLAEAIFHAGGCLYLRANERAVAAGRRFTLANCTFEQCRAPDGGAVAISGAPVAVVGCTFKGCISEKTGAALSTDAPLNLTETACLGCSALYGGCVSSTSDIAVRGGSFVRNVALLAGGGFYVRGGSLLMDNATATRNTELIRLLATLPTHPPACSRPQVVHGEGGLTYAYRATVTLRGSHFQENRAKDGAVLFGVDSRALSRGCAYEGGQATSGSAATMDGGTLDSAGDAFWANAAASFGVLAFTRADFVGCSFRGNQADSGTVYMGASALLVGRCLFAGNVALTQGGALVLVSGSQLAVEGSRFARNNATEGGAVYACNSSATTFTGSTFHRNAAEDEGGAIRCRDNGLTVVEGCLFEGNRAYEGTAIQGEGASALELADCAFRDNLSPRLTATQSTTDAMRGALALEGAEARAALAQARFEGNLGGGLCLHGGATARLGPGCTFAGNLQAGSNGSRPANAHLQAGCGLDIADPQAMTDPTLAGGSLWVYAAQGSQVTVGGLPQPEGPHNYLPQMRGRFLLGDEGATQAGRAAFAVPHLDAIVDLADPRADAQFEATCLFATAGRPNVTMPAMPWTVLGRRFLRCDLLDGATPRTYTLFLSNDGFQWTRFGELVLYADYTYLVVAGGITAGAVVLFALMGLMVFWWCRFVVLRRRTTLELATWRSQVVTTVDFGSLRILECIGHGADSDVFKGQLKGTGLVAVKRLYSRTERDDTVEERAQFGREMSLLKNVSHPNIVRFIGATHAGPTRPTSTGPRLNYLHSLVPPIAHRDVKCSNMLVTEDLHVKIADFGISMLHQGRGTVAAGTPAYAAPEVLLLRPSGLPADIFSYGLMRDVPAGRRLPLPQGVPAEVAHIITRCFVEDPEERPTAEVIVEHLTAYLRRHPYVAPLAAGPTEAPAASQRRQRRHPPATPSSASPSEAAGPATPSYVTEPPPTTSRSSRPSRPRAPKRPSSPALELRSEPQEQHSTARLPLLANAE
ncbi:putative Serine/threonine-protein kinase CTR1 [Paratrimastix pyriformis]|uniref:Serine/threonine-protein kinase CTR1 n=1 Tax=Paratrimastix pyriformis TaxID=342808 RepID=A0ABQ8UVC4_9EUKA|nr:putative Serine/threonine-protein kinase CTR1 [Paratrimastix pyriformis]